jgi:hypothetical protein
MQQQTAPNVMLTMKQGARWQWFGMKERFALCHLLHVNDIF